MELGRTQKLEIVRMVDFGAYLGTEEEQVLLPKKQVPEVANVGDEVKTNTGVKGVVHEVSVLRQRVKLVVTDEKGEKELVDYKVDDLIFRPRKRREKVKMDDELKKLEAMEKKERKSKL